MITNKLFNSIFPTKGLSEAEYNLVRRRNDLIDALNEFLPAYEINTHLRLCAFLATCGVETDYFKTSVEYAAGDDYDTRTDLGNTPQRDGDGRKYKGRGIIQTTGKYNYARVNRSVGKKFGIDLIKNPELLGSNIRLAVESACIFWKDNNLNTFADQGRFKELNGIVNRGSAKKTPLHWAKRNALYSLCKRRVPEDFEFAETSVEPSALVEVIPVVTPSEPTLQAASTADETDLAGKIDAMDFNVIQQNGRAASEVFKRPKFAKLLKRLGYWFAGTLGNIWYSSTGRIALILTLAACVGGVGYTIYYYRVQIKIGAKRIKSKLFKHLTGSA